MLYLDTSLLVTALTTEPEGARIETWIQSHSADDFLISAWVVTEFSAALSRKLRTQQIDPPQRGAAFALFSDFCASRATVLHVENEHFYAAARFADQHATGLRGGDALHLAIAFAHNATLCTLDRRLSDAGLALGVTTHLV